MQQVLNFVMEFDGGSNFVSFYKSHWPLQKIEFNKKNFANYKALKSNSCSESCVQYGKI